VECAARAQVVEEAVSSSSGDSRTLRHATFYASGIRVEGCVSDQRGEGNSDILGRGAVSDGSRLLAEGIDCPHRFGAEQSFELGEDRLDGIEVGTWQKPDTRPGGRDSLTHGGFFFARRD
jgi:hypothetical protein